MRTVLAELEREGIETELAQLADSALEPCRACYACKGKRACAFHNDRFSDCFEKMKRADGILLGSPVYSADVTGNMKTFLDRAGMIAAVNKDMRLLRHKVVASVTAVHHVGGMPACDTMNHFFLNKEAIIVGASDWNVVFGRQIGDVLKDEAGMNNMRNLGMNMAWVLKKLYGHDV